MLQSLLKFTKLYQLFQHLIAAENFYDRFVKEFVRPQNGERILDLGCGPAKVLEFLPAGVDYVGVDGNARYIESAKKKYGSRARFICSEFQNFILTEQGSFDVVLALGVLHHLNDDEVQSLFLTIQKALKPGGRYLTADGVFVKGQNPVAKVLLRADRGKFVRKQPEYLRLAQLVFPNSQSTVVKNWIGIPYNHIFLAGSVSSV